MALKTLEELSEINEGNREVLRGESWRAFIPEFSRDDKGNLTMKNMKGSVVYIATSDEQDYQNVTYSCVDCGVDVEGAKVAHPIHDGPFPLSGSGRCEYEVVPYCPNCEEKPRYHGSPITIGRKF
ncbi:MAG: hypothetical protein WDZ77_03280 [Candidatus Pacearchaeota archaeon]